MRIGSGGGLASEGEDIEVLELPIDQALAMIARRPHRRRQDHHAAAICGAEYFSVERPPKRVVPAHAGTHTPRERVVEGDRGIQPCATSTASGYGSPPSPGRRRGVVDFKTTTPARHLHAAGAGLRGAAFFAGFGSSAAHLLRRDRQDQLRVVIGGVVDPGRDLVPGELAFARAPSAAPSPSPRRRRGNRASDRNHRAQSSPARGDAAPRDRRSPAP